MTDLADVLASVGALLVTVPDSTPATANVRAPARAHRRSMPSIRWRWQWAPVLAVGLIAAIVLAVAPVRSAVAGWLGIGSTSIQIDPTPPSTVAPLPSIDAGLRRIDRATAAAAARFAAGQRSTRRRSARRPDSRRCPRVACSWCGPTPRRCGSTTPKSKRACCSTSSSRPASPCSRSTSSAIGRWSSPAITSCGHRTGRSRRPRPCSGSRTIGSIGWSPIVTTPS